MKQISMAGPIIKQNLKYKSENELYKMMLQIFNISKGWDLTPYQIIILTYYIRYGYSKDTKKMILENTKIKSVHSLNTQNCSLTDKKLLLTDNRNKNNKRLSEDLNKIKTFVEDKKKAILLEVLLDDELS